MATATRPRLTARQRRELESLRRDRQAWHDGQTIGRVRHAAHVVGILTGSPVDEMPWIRHYVDGAPVPGAPEPVASNYPAVPSTLTRHGQRVAVGAPDIVAPGATVYLPDIGHTVRIGTVGRTFTRDGQPARYGYLSAVTS